MNDPLTQLEELFKKEFGNIGQLGPAQRLSLESLLTIAKLIERQSNIILALVETLDKERQDRLQREEKSLIEQSKGGKKK